jgi:hypothetical protein
VTGRRAARFERFAEDDRRAATDAVRIARRAARE